MKKSSIPEKQNVVIIGGGNVGLVTLLTVLATKDPNYVIVMEPHAYLRKKAENLGASATFPPNKSQIRKFIKERGTPNHVFDCAGSEKSLNLALDIVKRGGTITLEGFFRGTASMPLMLLVSNEIRLQGVLGHDRDDILEAIQLFEEKKVDLGPFISKIVPLYEIQEAFEAFLLPGERTFVKVLVKL